ncbi:MAG: type 4b pilus protein PilO2 [Pseudomonadota bacterium]
MNMKIIHINNKPYAVHLWWQLHYEAKNSRKDVLLAARAMAKEAQEEGFTQEQAYNVVAIKLPQYGLGITTESSRIQSLAASIRPKISVNQGFIGIFRFTDGWWVCGISNQSVAAEGDRFFESENEARTHANHLADLFGEKEEAICLTQEESETYLAPLLASGVVVEPLYPGISGHSRLLRNVGIGVGIILVLCVAKWAWDTMASEAARNSSRQLMLSKAEREQAIAANIHRYFPDKWLDAPTVATMQNVCMSKLLAVPLVTQGWKMESALCSPSSLEVNWQHYGMASYVDLPPLAKLTSPKKAVSHGNISSDIQPRRQDKDLLKTNDVGIYLYEITRQLSCKLKVISWNTEVSRTIEGVKITSPWIEGQWALEAIPSPFIYSVVFDLLGQIPSLTITEISYANGQWAMKGNVYASR